MKNPTIPKAKKLTPPLGYHWERLRTGKWEPVEDNPDVPPEEAFYLAGIARTGDYFADSHGYLWRLKKNEYEELTA